MKIAFVLPGCGISGGIGIAFFYANALSGMGHDVDVINLSGIEYNYWYTENNFNVITCTEADKIGIISSKEYDCCIATFWTTLYQIRSGLVNTKSILYMVQGDEENFYPSDREMMRSGVKGTLVGPETKVVIARWLWEKLNKVYPNEDFKLIENGVDFDRFQSAKPFMKKGSRLRVLVEGPISEPIKRVRETLAYLRDIDGVESWLVSSVDGDLTGVFPDLSLFGLPWEHMPSIYKSCDVLIKNSATEGFPLPVMEMMASGGIPIVNRLPYTENFLIDKENSLILDNIDQHTLSLALSYVYSNIDELKKNASDTIKKYNWLLHAKEFENAIDQAVRNSTSAVKSHRVYASPDPEQLPTRWIRQTVGKTLAHTDETWLIVGWIAQAKGGDVYEASINVKDKKIDVSLSENRLDVVHHFNVPGSYGFRAKAKVSSITDPAFLNYKIEHDSDPQTLSLDLQVGRYENADIIFQIESIKKSDNFFIDFSTNKNLEEVFIKFKNLAEAKVNGVDVITHSLFEKDGTIEFKSESVELMIERFNS